MIMNKTTAKLTDDYGDVYYGREFDDVGICTISLAHYMLLKLKEKKCMAFRDGNSSVYITFTRPLGI